MLVSERRERFRRILAGGECVHPAGVFDPMSARMAESLGFQVGLVGGSIMSAVILGAPDIALITLTEFADQVRRIGRASDLSLMVDADHGYGNALNVMRTVEELEAAGTSALTIEDVVLPKPFGSQAEAQISIPEMVGKLRAAVAARRDPSLVIIGRTTSIRISGIEEAEKRVRAYEDAGIDAMFLEQVSSREEVEIIHRATSLPLILGFAPDSVSDLAFMAENGVRIAAQGHMPFFVATKAVYDTLRYLKEGGSPADLKADAASEELLSQFQLRPAYAGWQREYLSEA